MQEQVIDPVRTEADGHGDRAVAPRRDYALLSSAFTLGLLSLALAARGRRGELTRVDGYELPALALATFGLSRVLVHERVASWVRVPFVEEGVEGRPARGEGLRRALGELLTCTRCTGVWVGTGLVGLRVVAPSLGQVATASFAAAGANDLLQAGFQLLRGRPEQAPRRTPGGAGG